jgi:antitoxin component YwqK of YwqJK toxin-antitoxin module
MLSDMIRFEYPDNPMTKPANWGDVKFTSSWPIEAVDAPGAWLVSASAPFSEKSSAVVAVIDAGFYLQHLDLQGVALNDESAFTDPDGHGTMVTGIIAAQHNTGHGMAGMCPNAAILAVKTEFICWDVTAWVATSLRQPRNALLEVDKLAKERHSTSTSPHMPVKVVCLSYAKARDTQQDAEDLSKEYLLEAVEALLKADMVVVLGPANQKIPAAQCVPTALKKLLPGYKNLLLVSSSTRPQTGVWEGKMTAGYNGQSDVDVWAPGVAQTTLGNSSTEPYKLLGKANPNEGNSCAIPYAAGLAALMYNINKNLGAAAICDIIRETAETQEKGIRVINAFAASLRAYNMMPESTIKLAGFRLIMPHQAGQENAQNKRELKDAVIELSAKDFSESVFIPVTYIPYIGDKLAFCRFIAPEDLIIKVRLLLSDKKTCLWEGTLQEILRGASPGSHKSAWEHIGCKELRTIRLQGLALGVRYSGGTEALKNASVCLEHKATKVTFQAKTDENGFLVIPFGEPGPYKMVVEEDLPDGSKYEMDMDLKENTIYETDPRDAGKPYIEVMGTLKPKQDKLLSKKNYYKSGVLACEYTYFNVPNPYYMPSEMPSEMLHGNFTLYHENGKKKSEGKYVKGNKDGLWHEWFDDGKLESEGTYREGRKEGAWKETIMQFDMRVTVECVYKENLQEGKYVACWPDGKKFIEKNYVKGKEEGPYAMWDKDGKLDSEGTCKDGLPTGLWKNYFYVGGKVEEMHEELCENGWVKERTKHYYKDGVETNVTHEKFGK